MDTSIARVIQYSPGIITPCSIYMTHLFVIVKYTNCSFPMLYKDALLCC